MGKRIPERKLTAWNYGSVIEAIETRPRKSDRFMAPFVDLLRDAGDRFDNGDGLLDQWIGVAIDIGIGREVEGHVGEEGF